MSYPGGAFAVRLPPSLSDAVSWVEVLRQLQWVDSATRVVALSTTTYNPALNLVSSVSARDTNGSDVLGDSILKQSMQP